MSGLDSLMMSDLEVWSTLAILGGTVLLFVPVLGAAAARPVRRRGGRYAIAALLLAGAALGGLAWYGAPAAPNAALAVIAAGNG